MTNNTVAETVAAIKGIPAKEALLELLLNDLVEVTFNKLDGAERVMTCTLQSNYLPESKKDDLLSQTKIRNLEDKNIVVWDITAQSWRSFRYDRVTKVQLLVSQND
jgi:hypothetical protein